MFLREEAIPPPRTHFPTFLIVIVYFFSSPTCDFTVIVIVFSSSGNSTLPVPVIVDRMRKLTERECLALMGFPEWYKIDQNSMHSYKQVGNSVVVSIIEELAKEMVRVLS